jgi:hypothetical protein
MRQATTGQVRLEAGKAACFYAAARTTGCFDCQLPHSTRDLPLPKTPEEAILASNHRESEECR